MERDRQKLNFDEGRDIHNWDDLAALTRTGRPSYNSKSKKKKYNKSKMEKHDENNYYNDDVKQLPSSFIKPSHTIRLSKSFDKNYYISRVDLGESSCQ